MSINRRGTWYGTSGDMHAIAMTQVTMKKSRAPTKKSAKLAGKKREKLSQMLSTMPEKSRIQRSNNGRNF